MPAHQFFDRVHISLAIPELALGPRQVGLNFLPVPSVPTGAGEVLREFEIDVADQRGLDAGGSGRFTGGDIERTGQRVTARQLDRSRRVGLKNLLCLPQTDIHGLGDHGQHSLMSRVCRQLFRGWRQDVQFGQLVLMEPLAVDEAVFPGADFSEHFARHIGPLRFHLPDLRLGRPVFLLKQQVQSIDHRALADLVRAADNHHTAIGKVDPAMGDPAEIGQFQPMEFHP